MSRLAPVLRPRGYALGQAHARRIAIAALLLGVTLAATVVQVPRRMMAMHGRSKVEIAELTVKKYAWETFPEWQHARPDRTCPASLFELNEYMNNKDIRDPWGADYQWSCGTYGGHTQLNVWSIGEDGLLGSADDVRSNW